MQEEQKEDAQCHPVINVEETIGKWVGRKNAPYPSKIQESGRDHYKSLGFTVCPKGVYRFNSHEEADQWMMQIAVNRANQIADQLT